MVLVLIVVDVYLCFMRDDENGAGVLHLLLSGLLASIIS